MGDTRQEIFEHLTKEHGWVGQELDLSDVGAEAIHALMHDEGGEPND